MGRNLSVALRHVRSSLSWYKYCYDLQNLGEDDGRTSEHDLLEDQGQLIHPPRDRRRCPNGRVARRPLPRAAGRNPGVRPSDDFTLDPP